MIGDRRERCLVIDEQHEVLLAHQRLELRQGERRPVILSFAEAPDCCEAPFVHGCRAPSRRRAGRVPRTSRKPPSGYRDLQLVDPILQNSRCSELLPALRVRSGVVRVDADRSLQHWRAVDRQEGPLRRAASLMSRHASSASTICRDMRLLRAARNGLSSRRPACVLPAPARLRLHRRHQRICVGEELVLQPKGCSCRSQLCRLRTVLRAHERLQEGAIEREVDLGHAGRGGESALVFGIVAARAPGCRRASAPRSA